MFKDGWRLGEKIVQVQDGKIVRKQILSKCHPDIDKVLGFGGPERKPVIRDGFVDVWEEDGEVAGVGDDVPFLIWCVWSCCCKKFLLQPSYRCFSGKLQIFVLEDFTDEIKPGGWVGIAVEYC